MPTSSKTTSSTPSGREGNQLRLRATTGQPGQAQSLDEDHHQEKAPWGHDGSTNAALHGGGAQGPKNILRDGGRYLHIGVLTCQ